MTAQTEGQLSFGPTSPPALPGFTSLLSESDGSAEPVVRELIQNSLDAASDSQAEVRFIVEEVPAEEIPGLNDYRQAFADAERYRRRVTGHPSHDEQEIIARIKRWVNAPRVPVLFCVDNGCGIPPQRMKSLLTTGNTDKGEGGAGSFGVGHLAAFGASDLRYVLYGSHYWPNGDGPPPRISSGHAILATRDRPGLQSEDESCYLAAEGYWRSPRGTWEEATAFPETVPLMLARHLPEGTGTVVAILGFNDFRRSAKDLVAGQQIAQIAAANFLHAIHHDRLVVSVTDTAGEVVTVSSTSLEQLLGGQKHQMRATAKGQISGARAYAAYQALRYPDEPSVEAPAGVQIAWRSADAETGNHGTTVHVFRKGMWISSQVRQLERRDFGNCPPFTAVVNFSEGEHEQLVRDSEDPGHRRIEPKRLNDRMRREKLNELFKGIAGALRVAVGTLDESEDYTPSGFAELRGAEEKRKAETLRKPKNRSAGKLTVPVEPGGTRPGSGGTGKRQQGRPREGPVPRYAHAYRLDAPEKITVDLSYQEDVSDGHDIGIRVSLVSGSDQTCAQPFHDDWLRLISVSDTDHTTRSAAPQGDMELRLPATSTGQLFRTVEVELHASSAVHERWAHLVNVDIVKRLALEADSGAPDPSGSQFPDGEAAT